MSKALPKVPDCYYSVADVAAMWRFSEWWVRDEVRKGSFRDPSIADGSEDLSVLDLGGEIRISASALNRYARARVHVRPVGIVARNRGEALRKLNGQRAQGIPARDVVLEVVR